MLFGPLTQHITEKYRIEAGVIFSIFVIIILALIMSKNKPSTPSENHELTIINRSARKDKANKITIDIEGEVTKAGIYEMLSGSHIYDAVKVAGGYTKNADRTYIARYYNLAQLLHDQDKIYIPSRIDTQQIIMPQTEDAVSESEKNIIGIVNINTATLDELNSLPKIGAITAKKIVDNRPYSSIAELIDKKVVGPAIYEAIKESIGTD